MSAPARDLGTSLLSGGLTFDDDHELFRESVRGFISRDVAPSYANWRSAGALPTEIFAAAAEYGFLGLGIPEHLGGAGVDDPRFAVILVEECLHSGLSGLGLAAAIHNGVCIPFLRRFGSEEQQQRWFPALASGRYMAAVIDGAGLSWNGGSLTAELNGGPGTAGMSLLFVAVERGRHVLIIDAADSAVTTRPDSRGFIGVNEAPGITVELADHRPAAIEGMDELVRSTNAWMAVVHAAGAHAALRLGTQYVFERRVFGQLLANMENTKTVLGGAAAQTCAATELAYRTATDRGDDAGGDGGARAAAARHVAAAAHRRNADIGLQLHGGYGYMREYPIAQAYADAAVLTSAPWIGARAEHSVAAALGL